VANNGPISCGPGSLVIVPPKVTQKIAADPVAPEEMRTEDYRSVVHDGLLLVDAAGGRLGDLRLMCDLIISTDMASHGVLNNVKKPIVEDFGEKSFVRDACNVMLK
jgi:hypothetical protein